MRADSLSSIALLRPLFARKRLWMQCFAKTVQLVRNREHGMSQQHSRSGETHDRFGLCFSRRLVTMDRAVGAGWLVFSVGALLEPQLGVIQELTTGFAQRIIERIMMRRTVDADHLADRQPLTCQARLIREHEVAPRLVVLGALVDPAFDDIDLIRRQRLAAALGM